MPTEPTEDDARLLLIKAAATIDVDDSAPMTLTGLPEPGPRRWPVLAAAAAVALAIGGGYLVAQQFGEDPQPEPPPANTDREPVEQEHVYGDGELPSLLGYTEQEAVRLLTDRGIEVRKTLVGPCALQGLVVGTTPGPGTTLGAGDVVELRVTNAYALNDGALCAIEEREIEVWDLVRFARGRGPAPDFPDGVSIAVGEGEYVDLTSAEAADPEKWVLCDDGGCHSALAALEQILTTPVEMDGFFAHIFLEVTDTLTRPFNGPDPVCVTSDPLAELDVLKYHPSTFVYVDYPKDGGWFCPPPPVLQIEWTKDRRISSVLLRLAVEDEPVDTESLDATRTRASAAEAFVAWARRNGPAPEFADRVRVMYGGGGAFGSTGWVDDPENRILYSGCSGLGFPDCGVDPVGMLHRYKGPVVPAAGRSTCADGGEVPRRFAGAEQDVVRLEEPEPANCRNAWAVELWIDEDGVIYGVNQAGSY